MNKSKLQELLNKIEAKLKLEMKVTDCEWSLYLLYRDIDNKLKNMA